MSINKITGLHHSILALIKSRVEIIFAFSWTATLGCLIAGKGFPALQPTFLAITCSIFLTLAVYLYNDVIDREMDQSSANPRKSERPIAFGRVPVNHAMIFIYFCSIMGILISYFINTLALSIALFYWITFMLYSFPLVRLKRIFVVKSLVTASGPSLAMLIGGAAVLNTLPLGLIFASITQGLFMFLVLPSMGDSFDIEEDTQFGMKTMAMVLSWENKARMMVSAPLMVIISVTFMYSILGFNMLLPALSIISSILLLRMMMPLTKEFNENVARRTRRITYAYFMLLPVFVTLGSLNLSFLAI